MLGSVSRGILEGFRELLRALWVELRRKDRRGIGNKILQSSLK